MGDRPGRTGSASMQQGRLEGFCDQLCERIIDNGLRHNVQESCSACLVKGSSLKRAIRGGVCVASLLCGKPKDSVDVKAMQ